MNTHKWPVLSIARWQLPDCNFTIWGFTKYEYRKSRQARIYYVRHIDMSKFYIDTVSIVISSHIEWWIKVDLVTQ